LVLFVDVEEQVVVWTCGRVGVRVKSVVVVRVRAAVEVTGREVRARRRTRAIGWDRLEVSIVGVGAGVCGCVSKA